MNTIIEKIRAEVNRLMRENSSSSGLEGGVLDLTYEDGINTALNDVLEILDTLQEQPVKTNIVEDLKHYLATTPKEQIEKDWESLKEWGKVGPTVSEFLGWKQPVCDGLEEEIDKRWKEWLSEDKEQAEGILPKSEFSFYARHFYELGRQSKPKVCEGLEEEISRYLREDCSDDDEPSISEVARHFAKWGAEYRGGSETPKETIPREGPPCLI